MSLVASILPLRSQEQTGLNPSMTRSVPADTIAGACIPESGAELKWVY